MKKAHSHLPGGLPGSELGELYSPAPYGRKLAREPYDELLDTQVMVRILDEVSHGVPAECVEALVEGRGPAAQQRSRDRDVVGEPPEFRDAGEAAWAGTAQDPEQHGLEVVVGVVRGQDQPRAGGPGHAHQRRIAGLAPGRPGRRPSRWR